MNNRILPCIYYICAHETCQKNIKDVTLKRCKNCSKYRSRKSAKHSESVRAKRQKDRDRHDNWKHAY